MATTTNGNRTPEQVTREIEREREQLATAVSHLRGELKQAADVRSILKAHAPKLALATAVLVGLKVARTMARRRASTHAIEDARGHDRFSFGRFTLVERD
jgi:hypothetical protein